MLRITYIHTYLFIYRQVYTVVYFKDSMRLCFLNALAWLFSLKPLLSPARPTEKWTTKQKKPNQPAWFLDWEWGCTGINTSLDKRKFREDLGVAFCLGGVYQEEGARSYPTLPRVHRRTVDNRAPKLNQGRLPLDIRKGFHCEGN